MYMCVKTMFAPEVPWATLPSLTLDCVGLMHRQ